MFCRRIRPSPTFVRQRAPAMRRSVLPVRPTISLGSRRSISCRTPAKLAASASQLRERRATVLIVDDDRGTREIFAGGLRMAGLEVEIASTAAEAIARAPTSRWDAAVIDLRLPDMSGTDLVRTFQATGVVVPFIVMSGFMTTQATVEAMRLGASEVLDKPVDVNNLCAAVLHTIGSVAAKA